MISSGRTLTKIHNNFFCKIVFSKFTFLKFLIEKKIFFDIYISVHICTNSVYRNVIFEKKGLKIPKFEMNLVAAHAAQRAFEMINHSDF